MMVSKNTSLGKSVKEQKLIKNLLHGTPFKFRAKDLDKDSIFENNEKWNENNMKAMEGEIVSEDVINYTEGKEQHFRHIIAPVKDENEIIGTLGVMVDISGYKQSDIDFRKSEEMQKTFFSQAMEGIFKMEFEKPVSIKLPVDEQIKLFYKYCYLSECNESLAKMYGYKSPEKIKGMKLIEFHNDPNDIINIETQKNFINSNYHVYNSETKEVDKEGKVKYYINSAVGIIENEFLIGIWGTQIDITERKKTEVALKESEERYRRLTEYSPETIVVHSKGIVVYINEAGVKLLGGKVPNDIIGKPVLEFVYPDFKQIVVERIKRSQEEKKHSEILEEKFITLDGRVIDVEVTAIPFDYNGTPSSQVIVKDITELKRDEKIKSAVYKISDLIHSIQTLDELYLSVHQIISGLMPANNFYIALYDEQIGLISFPYFVDEYDEKPSPKKPGRGLTEYVLRTGKPLLASPEVFDDLLKKGEVESIGAVSIDWLGVPLKIKDKVIGILTVQTYTEGIRYTVQEMNILNFISEQIAMSISSKKAEEELLKAKTSAEESSKLKSNLLANMSHELRTPMNGILGFAEILLEDTTDAYTREMIQNIFDSGKRLMRTLNSIMDLSQLEAGSDIINLSEFDLNREIQSIIKSFIPVANQKNLYLNSVLPDSVIINSDKNIIQQIVTNLIDNALKFTVSGGVTVEVIKNNVLF